MEEILKIASPTIGKYLTFEDRNSILLSNKCFETIHLFNQYHSWTIKYNLDFKSKIKALKKYLPNINHLFLSIKLEDSLFNFQDIFDLDIETLDILYKNIENIKILKIFL